LVLTGPGLVLTGLGVLQWFLRALPVSAGQEFGNFPTCISRHALLFLVQKFHFDKFPGITVKIIEVPAKRLGFSQICLAPGKDAARTELLQTMSAKVWACSAAVAAVSRLASVRLLIFPLVFQ